MKKWLIILLCLPITAIAANGETPKEQTELFFKSVLKGDISSAYDRLFVGSSIPKEKPQAVSVLKQQTQSGLPLYGEILGYERIRVVKYGTSIMRLVYVLKSEKAPTVWEFHFYKPKKSWVLTNVLFNDQYDLLK